MQTSTKLVTPMSVAACAQLMARSMKSFVAKSRITVRLSHERAAVRRISSCAGPGSSSSSTEPSGGRIGESSTGGRGPASAAVEAGAAMAGGGRPSPPPAAPGAMSSHPSV